MASTRLSPWWLLLFIPSLLSVLAVVNREPTRSVRVTHVSGDQGEAASAVASALAALNDGAAPSSEAVDRSTAMARAQVLAHDAHAARAEALARAAFDLSDALAKGDCRAVVEALRDVRAARAEIGDRDTPAIRAAMGALEESVAALCR